MTLPELAALSAERVPGFHLRRPDHGAYAQPDTSPAELLMAVVQHSLEFHALEHDIVFVRGVRGGRVEGKCSIDDTEMPNEDMARAALVALLRANGVEPTASTPKTTAS